MAKRKARKSVKKTSKKTAPKRKPVRATVRAAPVKAAPVRKFKQNHAWAVLGLIFAILALVLIWYQWYPGLIFSVLAIVFAENQKNILHSKMNAFGMVLGIIGFILYVLLSCAGFVC
ncbi:hypothetical protein KY328_04465 [Candidatus Woesearchaeota archaeon]|nr:hypothetical protein [Candidatus Woesearchaeota archaeon]MBW3022153.1 hypothetical protein [Candidatus Woesearchaeota archaeon]